MIRAKYSSPSSTSEDNDASQSDDQKSKLPVDGLERNLRIRSSSNRGQFPQAPNTAYSTSGSDSDDSEKCGTLTRASTSRSSVLSSSSTVTLKSTSSGGAFRRNRVRSSVASTKSSASDKTLNGDTEQASIGPSTDTVDGHQKEEHTSKIKEKTKASSHRNSQDGLWSADDDLNDSEDKARLQDASSMLLDPTVLAQKVLAETRQERMALEHMQRLSIHTDDKPEGGKDIADLSSDTDLQTSGLGSSLSSPQTSSSSVKPVGCVAPNVQSPKHAESKPKTIENTPLKKFDDGQDLSSLEAECKSVEAENKHNISENSKFSSEVQKDEPNKTPVVGVSGKARVPPPVKPKTVKFNDVVQSNTMTPEPEQSPGDSSMDSSIAVYSLPENFRSTPGTPPSALPPYSAFVRPTGNSNSQQSASGDTERSSPQEVSAKIVRTAQARANIAQYSMSAQSEPVNAKQMVSMNLPSKSNIISGPNNVNPVKNASNSQINLLPSKPTGPDRTQPMQQQQQQMTSFQQALNRFNQVSGPLKSLQMPNPGQQKPVEQKISPQINGNTGGFQRYVGSTPQMYKPPPPYPGPRLPGGANNTHPVSPTTSLPPMTSSARPLMGGQSHMNSSWYDSKSSDSEMSAILESPLSDASSQRSSLYDGSGQIVANSTMPLRTYDLPNHSTTALSEPSNLGQSYLQGLPYSGPMTPDNVMGPPKQSMYGQSYQQPNKPRGFIQNNFSSANTVEIVSGPDSTHGYTSESDIYGSSSTLNMMAPAPGMPSGGKVSNPSDGEDPVYENLKWFSDMAKHSSYSGSRHSHSPISTGSVHSQSSSYSSSGYPATQPQYTTHSRPPPYNHALYTRQQALPRQAMSSGHQNLPPAPQQPPPQPPLQQQQPVSQPQYSHMPASNVNRNPPAYGHPQSPNHRPSYEVQGQGMQRQPLQGQVNTGQVMQGQNMQSQVMQGSRLQGQALQGQASQGYRVQSQPVQNQTSQPMQSQAIQNHQRQGPTERRPPYMDQSYPATSQPQYYTGVSQQQRPQYNTHQGQRWYDSQAGRPASDQPNQRQPQPQQHSSTFSAGNRNALQDPNDIANKRRPMLGPSQSYCTPNNNYNSQTDFAYRAQGYGSDNFTNQPQSYGSHYDQRGYPGIKSTADTSKDSYQSNDSSSDGRTGSQFTLQSSKC